jgi:hypothetical protein
MAKRCILNPNKGPSSISEDCRVCVYCAIWSEACSRSADCIHESWVEVRSGRAKRDHWGTFLALWVGHWH